MHRLLLFAALIAASPVPIPRSPAAADEITRTLVRRQGQDGVHTYRIPGLVTSKKGTLIAVFDIRHKNAGDLPGDIDVGLCRSEDNGKTWQPMQTILDFDAKEPGTQGNGVGDPAVVVDWKKGTILVMALWSHGNRAWHGSGPGTSPEETGQIVLTQSDDDGLTWSKPRNITAEIRGRDPSWRLLFQGPGRGIDMGNGKLIFAGQYRDADGTPHSCLLYSEDHGQSWAVSSAAIPGKPATSEAQIAQIDHKSLLISMRDESRGGKRLWARYEWEWRRGPGSGKWSENWSELPDPTCMGSLISDVGSFWFSNCNSATQRKDLTLRSSYDEGKTWEISLLIQAGPCMYSCLTVMDDGAIGVLYETGPKAGIETLTFARVYPHWLIRGTLEPLEAPKK